MNIVSFGSLNLDHVYSITHVVQPQETLLSTQLKTFCGGKGLNQTAAVAAALMSTADSSRMATEIAVLHAGCVGSDDDRLVDQARRLGVDTRFIRTVDAPTGHAIIQVTQSGENAIIVHGGANRCVSSQHITAALDFCAAGDVVVLQNEINAIPDIMEQAARRKLKIFFNAAPCGRQVREYPLHLVHTLLVNEIEGQQLSDEREPQRIIDVLTERYPHSAVIITIGAEGALYGRGTERHRAAAYPFDAVDTTAAGDTFCRLLRSPYRHRQPTHRRHAHRLLRRVAVDNKRGSVAVPSRATMKYSAIYTNSPPKK